MYLSQGIVEATTLVENSRAHCVMAYSTRGMATLWPLIKMCDIYAAASWLSPHNFVRFYHLYDSHFGLSLVQWMYYGH